MVDERRLSEALSNFARAVATDGSIHQIAGDLVAHLSHLLAVAGVGLTMRDPSTSVVVTFASDDGARRFEELQHERSDGPGWHAAQTGRSVVVADLHADRRFAAFAAAALPDGPACVVSFPLGHDGDLLGSVSLYGDVIGELDPIGVTIARTFVDVAASYLRLAARRDEALSTAETLKELSLRDPLTGLANRQLLEDRIRHAAEHSRRNQMSAAVLFVDLDQFKHVNDAYGHAVGDALMTAVAQRLSASLRASDTLARVSGDEFVFLCEDLTSRDDVDVIARRVADAFCDPFEALGREVSMTASIGAAFATTGDEISPDLVALADTAMYEAKRARCVH
jgi:diguanylate cyclase (GGDEF)-like protein